MRSEIRTAIAVLATSAVLLGSATMALAADGDPVVPDPVVTTTPASPSPSTTSPSTEPTDGPTTPGPTEPSPSVTTSEPTSPAPTETTPPPTPIQATPPPAPAGAFTVSNAQLRWGVNDESNNAAFAPGTFNFFSAGKVANPGTGGLRLTPQGWKQTDGNVHIEKFGKTSWAPATWDGLSTDSSGATLTTSGATFSNHEVVMSAGTGTVDPKKRVATIQWTGSFTVVYYSGLSFFYVTDPKLTVAGGVGTLTGTLSGYGSSMDDPTKWSEIPPAPSVVLANLGSVDLSKNLGFTAAPAYRGVAVSVPGNTQVREGANWGSFPQSFVDFQTSSGTGSYWYSSGGAADAHKVAKPVTVSYAAGKPIKVKPAKKKSKKTPAVKNDVPKNTPIAPPAPNVAALSLPAPEAAAVVQSAPPIAQFRPVSTVTGIQPRVDSSDDTTGIWILGGALLAAALLVTLSPIAYSAIRTER